MTPQRPEIVEQVVAIPLAHIVVGERLRPIDPVWAAALGKIMSVDGQETPIRVRPIDGNGYLLIVGGHRLEGARLEGFKTINAIISDVTDIEARALEVTENLWRRDLAPLDRAAFVAEKVELLKAAAGLSPEATPQSIAAQARWQKQLAGQAADASVMMSDAYGFTEAVGEQVGIGARTIRRDLELHRGLPASLVNKVRGLPIAKNAAQLRALARMPEADQRAVVELLVEGKAKGATDALGMLRQKPAADPEKKAWSAFLGGWSRLNARKRREALRELAEMGLPAGIRIEFDGGDDE